MDVCMARADAEVCCCPLAAVNHPAALSLAAPVSGFKDMARHVYNFDLRRIPALRLCNYGHPALREIIA